ncbi:MAG: phosphorylase [Holophagaceae bacterium]|nr:phosphorylase [Holophagaceae bacterium]
MTKKLLLAAFEPELAQARQLPLHNWQVALTGIGGITASISTARLVSEMRPKKVLFVGSCGAYTDSIQIGDCIATSEVLINSISEIHHRAYRPQREIIRWQATWELPLPKHVVLATPAITSSIEDATLLSQLATVEHLELAGVFAACQQADVPVAAALVVANRVGPNAHLEWKANHATASQRLICVLNDLGVFG